MKIDNIKLKQAIILLIGGYLNSGGDLDDAIDSLEELRNDYKNIIKKERSEIKK